MVFCRRRGIRCREAVQVERLYNVGQGHCRRLGVRNRRRYERDSGNCRGSGRLAADRRRGRHGTPFCQLHVQYHARWFLLRQLQYLHGQVQKTHIRIQQKTRGASSGIPRRAPGRHRLRGFGRKGKGHRGQTAFAFVLRVPATDIQPQAWRSVAPVELVRHKGKRRKRQTHNFLSRQLARHIPELGSPVVVLPAIFVRHNSEIPQCDDCGWLQSLQGNQRRHRLGGYRTRKSVVEYRLLGRPSDNIPVETDGIGPEILSRKLEAIFQRGRVRIRQCAV